MSGFALRSSGHGVAVVGDTIGRAARGLAVREAVGIVVRLVGGVVTLALIGPAEAGRAATAVALVAVLVIVAQCGGDALLVRSRAADEQRRAQEVLGALVVTTGIVSLAVITGCAALSGRSRPGSSGAHVAALVAVLAISIPLNVLWAPAQAMLERGLHFGRLGLLELAGDATQHLVAVTVALRVRSAWAVVVGQIAAQAVLLVGSYALAGLRPRPRWRGETTRELLVFGVSSVPASLVPRASDALSLVVVGARLGADAAGFVALCARIVDTASSGLRVLQRVALPTFARLQGDTAALHRARERGALACATLGLVPFVVLGLAGPVVVPLLGGRWSGAVGWLPFAGAPVVLAAPFALHSAALVASGRERVVLRSALAGLALQTAGLLLLVGPIGRSGWGIARLLLVVTPVLQARALREVDGPPMRAAVVWNAVAIPAGLSAGATGGMRAASVLPIAVALAMPPTWRLLGPLWSAGGVPGVVADPVDADGVDAAGPPRWCAGHHDDAVAELCAPQREE